MSADWAYFAVFGEHAKSSIEEQLGISSCIELFCVHRVTMEGGSVLVIPVAYSDENQALELIAFGKEAVSRLRELINVTGLTVLNRPEIDTRLVSIDKNELVYPLRYHHDQAICQTKAYFVGRLQLKWQYLGLQKPEFVFPEPSGSGDNRPVMYSWHRERGAQMSRFAGWLMPIWYSSIRTEHRTVRSAAGLFDLSHMGIFKLKGPGACRFLNALFTNYVLTLEVGKSQYGFLLKPDGDVLDDCIVYRLALDEFLLITNAANSSGVKSWLVAARSRRFAVDPYDPCIEIEAECDILDLSCSIDNVVDDRLVTFALQGPNSLAILRDLLTTVSDSYSLLGLDKGNVRSFVLKGAEVLVARTGYTGEKNGYEIFVHPEQASYLWESFLHDGQKHGLVPTGLGARDSLRIEAGFPLFGKELGGQHGISPIEAGYGAYVKMHKAFFVGRESILRTNDTNKRHIIRFEVASNFRYPIRNGDIVMDGSARTHIGIVTSCAFADHGQIGLAICDMDVEAGVPINLWLQRRSRICLGEAVVVTRFY